MKTPPSPVFIDDEHTSIYSDIEQYIQGYQGNKSALYDYVMSHKEYVTKEQLLNVLEKIGRPPNIKFKESEKIKTFRSMKVFFIFKRGLSKEHYTNRELLRIWFDNLDPSNPYEEDLKYEVKNGPNELPYKKDFEDIYKRLNADLKKYTDL